MEDSGVVVTDLDSNLIVFRLDNSEIVWDRVGLASDTVMFGSPAPAFANGELVLVGAHGEVSYFSAVDGELLWNDSVAVFNPRTPIEGIGDVRAHPVHDGGMLFVISQSGRIAAFNARSGLLVWISLLVALRCRGLPVKRSLLLVLMAACMHCGAWMVPCGGWRNCPARCLLM